MSHLFDTDYKKLYEFYRKLHGIAAIITAVTGGLAWKDMVVLFAIGEQGGMAVLTFLFGWIGVAIATFVEYILLALTMSPTIVMIDALVSIDGNTRKTHRLLSGMSTPTAPPTVTADEIPHTATTTSVWTCSCGAKNPSAAKYCSLCFKPRA